VEHSDSNISLKHRLEQQEKYIDAHFSDMGSEKEVVSNPPELKPELQSKKAVSQVKPPKSQVKQVASSDEAEVKVDVPALTKTTPPQVEEEVVDNSWLVRLDGLKSKMSKLDIIFSNDKGVGNLFYFDTFRDNICFNRKPYWHRKFKEGVALADKDMAHIRAQLDKVFDVRGEKQIDDAIVVEADKIQKNKVLDWFDNIKWDGTDRLEFFFNKFFHVPLTPFTRVAFKHWMIGAVSRIYDAGAPMDLLLIIKGKQGIGKSLFFKRLATMDFGQPGEHLYSDTKIDFNKTKDSYEQLEGIWIYEWKELAGMNMSDQESIKAFVDKTEDKFRRSYGRRNVEIKRRVAFGGSTNANSPLRDRTGNRRFLVMESPLDMHQCFIKDMKKFTQAYRDQLIAEAIHLYETGYDIFAWTDEQLKWWEKSNQDNLVENDFSGRISSYLDMKRPKAWYSMSVDQMRFYMQKYDFDNNENGDVMYSDSDLETPNKVCIPELWQIALGQRDITINRYQRDLMYQSIENLEWKIDKTKQMRFGVFGHQRPIMDEREDDELPF